MLSFIKRGFLMLFVFGMILANHARAQITFSVQPDASTGKDAMINSAVPTATAPTIAYIGAIRTTAVMRGLLQFDLSSIPPNSVVTGAKLTLSGSSVSGGNATYLSRVSASWTETGATWTNMNANFTTTDQLSVPATTASSVQIDVTDHVQKFVITPSTNYGWMFRLQNEATVSTFSFSSSDGTTASLRPKLEVTYVPCPSPLTITVTPTPPCQGQQAQLNVPAGDLDNYSWSGTSTYTTVQFTSSLIRTTNAGTYTVTHPVCGTASVAVTFTPVPTLTASPASQTVCAGSAVSGRTFAISPSVNTVGTWTNSNTNIGLPATGTGNIASYTAPNVTSQQIGVITVKPLSNTTGCTGSALTFTIVINPRPPLSMGLTQFITCAVPNPTVSGSSTMPGVTYSWVPGGSTPTNSSTAVSANGTYSLTATNPTTGCRTTSVVTVSTNVTAPSVSASVNGTITCTNPSRTLTASSSDGIQFAWTGPTAGASAGTTPNSYTTSITLGGTYTVTATDPANGCTATATVAVVSNTALPNVTPFLNPTITCTNTLAVLSSTSTTSGVTFAWTGTVVGVPAGTTPTQYSTAVTAPGNYTFTVTNPVNGCKSTLVRTAVNNTAPPVVNAGNNKYVVWPATVVIGGSPSASGGTTPYSYSWTPATALNNATNANPICSTNTSISYTLMVTGDNGCKASSSMYVIANPAYCIVLKRAHDAETYLTNNAILYFKFEEEYTKQNSNLKYVLYNDKHQVVPSAIVLPEVIGDNRYQLNLSTLGLTIGENYSIEVFNEKSESWVARFIYK